MYTVIDDPGGPSRPQHEFYIDTWHRLAAFEIGIEIESTQSEVTSLVGQRLLSGIRHGNSPIDVHAGCAMNEYWMV